jgi:teichuronic acid biosynthesis glycosyltransferase TuaH
VFVAGHPHDVLGRWGDRVINVLYGTDDWVAGALLTNQDPRRLVVEERAALARADLVLAVGPELADRWRALGAQPVEFPNGCDAQTYLDMSQSERATLPAGFPEPVAGLIGRLNERIDPDLLMAAADSGVGVLLVGPPEPRWWHKNGSALLSRSNVHHVGPVPFDEVARWLARVDVGLVPYADSDFNRASFPLKTLEYLAAGLPVVSTDLPASRRLRMQTDQLWIAPDRTAFVEAVWEAARMARSPDAVRQRQGVARKYSWASRAEEFAQLTGLRAEARAAA